jgi:hypothetical protein
MRPGLAAVGERVRLETYLDDLMKNQRGCVRVHITRAVGRRVNPTYARGPQVCLPAPDRYPNRDMPSHRSAVCRRSLPNSVSHVLRVKPSTL